MVAGYVPERNGDSGGRIQRSVVSIVVSIDPEK